MAITVTASPTSLTWANFTVVPNQMTDPSDGTTIDAFTAFNFAITPDPPKTKTVNGQFAFDEPMTITITPVARVWSGVLKTEKLLSHEQWHYDVGIVTARALAKQIPHLRGANFPALIQALRSAITLHFTTRAGILQKRYDLDTRHGEQSHYQKIWKDRMTSVLANPRVDQIGGFYL